MHVLVDETKRVCFSRIHPHQRYYVFILMVKESAYVNFIAKPLQLMELLAVSST